MLPRQLVIVLNSLLLVAYLLPARLAKGDDILRARTLPQLQQPWQNPSRCGINCLYFMLRINNINIGYDSITSESHLTERGSSLHELHVLGERCGLPNRIIRARPESLDRLPLPAIAHISSDVDEGHYVVIVNIQYDANNGKSKYVHIIDGTSCLVEKRELGFFLRSWTGYLMVSDSGRLDQAMKMIMFILVAFTTVLYMLYVILKLTVRRKHSKVAETSEGVS